MSAFQLLVRALDANDRAAAAALADRIDPRENFAIECIRLALRLRDAGWTPEAELVLTRVVDRAPDELAAHYELAFLRRLRGDHAGAADLLRVAVASGAATWRFKSALSHMLYSTGDTAEANRWMLSEVPADPGEFLEWQALRQFGLFVREFPQARAMALIDAARARHGWLDTPDVAAAVVAAVRAKTPFALIRLGDGEGGNLRVDAADERAFAQLYAQNRRELIGIWFGPAFDWQGQAFADFMAGFPELMREADILGVPYPSWMTHEYTIASLRGIPSLVNVFRVIEGQCPTFSGTLCSQHIHIDLHAAQELEGVFGELDEIGLISCFPDLPDLLRRRFGFKTVHYTRIPGEFASLRNDASLIEGQHFPDVYGHVLADIAATARGRVVLVAGGILGKAYAIAVKRAGGVGLDLGSLVDAWTGRTTRPGYSEKMRL